MSTANNFINHFLIAMPQMLDPNFQRTVSYICEHNEQGAVAIIINRPLDLKLDYIFDTIQIENAAKEAKDIPVYFGGPLQQDRGFVLHRPCGEWRSSVKIADNVAVTTSQDILEALAEHKGPDEVLVALGYAGWEAGQLELEIAQNVWLCCPADENILFNTPVSERWKSAASLLGVDLKRLFDDIGHA